jgi:hypothetical protein
MVYPKKRATELAATANVVVPSVDDSFYDTATVDTMKTVEVVPVNPTTTAVAPVDTAPRPVTEPAPAAATTPREELPSTASPLPLIALFGFVTLALGLALRGYSTGRSSR